MKTVEQHLENITGKLHYLIRKYTTLRKEALKLTSELNELKTREKSLTEKISVLETETSILKASAGKMSEKEKAGFEKQINQYIKDLEKCMTMLNK